MKNFALEEKNAKFAKNTCFTYSKQNNILDLLYFSERYAGDSDYCCGVFVSSPRLSA